MALRRPICPRRVFTPTQRTPPSTHYLLLFEETNSYQIAARSSLKQINGDIVSIMVRNKLLQAIAVFSGSIEDCNREYARLTHMSQNEINDHDDDDLECNDISVIRKIPEKAQIAEQEESSNDDQESFLDCRKRLKNGSSKPLSKKVKNLIVLNDETIDAVVDENNRTTKQNSNVLRESNTLQDIDIRMNELNEKMISNSSRFDQQMQKLFVKIDRLTSNINVNKHAIEPYLDKTGEKFPQQLMFKDQNLLDIMATDYGDYSRKVLRLIFTSDELKNSILPPGKPYLTRPPLDTERFKIFMDAVRYKFKLDSVNFGLFYRSLLRRKLTDFLIEERRRELMKDARRSLKAVETQQSCINFD